ncbi:EamA family transporter [Curtobacterium sp. Csp1]|uniref:EamA family transporter n=1 Tax=Curtobacterium sp. Csp1 TaxID=2495429 RepID=UPI0020C63E5B|nr:hypothetical protein [Curtobacterium sp. Csp1]
MTIALGIVVLRERLRAAQWAAVGISIVAVVVIAVGYGQVPWISLTLAFSFGLYGLVKKRVGGTIDALSGLTIETLWLLPIAVGVLVVLGVTGLDGGVTFTSEGWPHVLVTVLTGPATAVPLLLFASSARRVSLSTLGLTQYLAPVMQLLVGVVVQHEAMPPARRPGQRGAGRSHPRRPSRSDGPDPCLQAGRLRACRSWCRPPAAPSLAHADTSAASMPRNRPRKRVSRRQGERATVGGTHVGPGSR